jgi:hypothetical protein
MQSKSEANNKIKKKERKKKRKERKKERKLNTNSAFLFYGPEVVFVWIISANEIRLDRHFIAFPFSNEFPWEIGSYAFISVP